MNELQAFDYSQLSNADQKFLREREQQIKSLARMTAREIAEIGAHLIEVKERIGHGKFLEWIAAAFKWSERAANNSMSVHRHFKFANFPALKIDVSALYLLAEPKMPEPVRKAVIERATAGHHVSHAEVKALRAHYSETGELPKDLGKLVAMAADAKKETDANPNPLPGPAEARRIAIATGMHTMDKTGAYQPPMSVADQEAWRADNSLALKVSEFLRWTKEEAGPPRDFAAMLCARHWRSDIADEDLIAAISWLELVRSELCGEQKRAS